MSTKPLTKIIYYREEKIMITAGMYWYNGLGFKTLKKVKIAIDNTIYARINGLD